MPWTTSASPRGQAVATRVRLSRGASGATYAHLLHVPCISSAHLVAIIRWSAAKPAATTNLRALENNVSEKTTSGGPSVGLLLLIPAAAIVAHAAMRHHRMMWAEIGEPGAAAPYRRHRRHRFAGPESETAARDGFRLPPRIEWMLDTWHTRAHQAAEPTDAPEA